MATSTDLAQPILANLPIGGPGTVDFWDDEASVNGVWNGLLARFFPGTLLPAAAGALPMPVYIIAPEGQAEPGARALRADLLVSKFVYNFALPPPVPLPLPSPVLHFEGKKSSGATWEEIRAQIQKWFTNNGNSRLSGGRLVWAIGARGKEWKAFVCAGKGTLQSLKLRASPTPAKVLVNDPSSATKPLDISTLEGHAVALQCLQYMSTRPFPITADFQ